VAGWLAEGDGGGPCGWLASWAGWLALSSQYIPLYI
jgi:hypothetical protein